MAKENANHPIYSWMLQLSSAAATLETIGFVHGDIKPQNILVDDQDALKLGDLDHALPIGADLEVGEEPYVRVHRPSVEGGGIYGRAGPETEQFALGSILWYITRGEEAYAELDGFSKVNRLSDCQFPDPQSGNPIENIIHKCWFRKFDIMADLLCEVRTLAAMHCISEDIHAASISATEYLARKELCNRCYNLLLEEDTTEGSSTRNATKEHLTPEKKIPRVVHYLQNAFNNTVFSRSVITIIAIAGSIVLVAAWFHRRH